MYEINSDKIQSMALYDNSGNLIASEPIASEKDNVDVKSQSWFSMAKSEIENIHFLFLIYRICLKMVLINIIGLCR